MKEQYVNKVCVKIGQGRFKVKVYCLVYFYLFYTQYTTILKMIDHIWFFLNL